MGQNNDPKERGDLQGQQGAQPKLSPEERKRQSGYPTTGKTEYMSEPAVRRESNRDDAAKK